MMCFKTRVFGQEKILIGECNSLLFLAATWHLFTLRKISGIIKASTTGRINHLGLKDLNNSDFCATGSATAVCLL